MNKTNAANTSMAQPKGLTSLFLVELWERFGFYAVQAILVLYLTKIFHLSDNNAYDIFAITASFMYASPFIGGFLADKLIGYRNAILLGSVLLAIGYWLLMVSSLHVFYWAMALIIMGNGFFKSNVSTMVGLLYQENDPRRDSGFTIFYMGINIGSFLGPMMSGVVADYFGWSTVFAVSGFGLVLALVIALLTFRTLGSIGLQPKLARIKLLGVTFSAKIFTALVIVTIITSLGLFMQFHEVANLLFLAVCFLCVLGILMLSLKCQGQDRNNMLVLTVLFLFSIIFWAIYNQTFSSLVLFTDRIVNRNVLGYEIPTVVFQSVNPFLIVALTPFFAKLWQYVDLRKNWLSSGSAKFSLALVIMGLAYAVLIVGIMLHDPIGKVNVFWLNASYLLQTIGELFLSPIGLSLASELAPKQYRGMMMGAWMLSISGGYSLGDYFSKFSSIPQQLMNAPIISIEYFYQHAFTIYMCLSLLAGLALFLLNTTLNKKLLGLGAR